MPTGSDSTDGEKRKRGNSEVDSEEESNAMPTGSDSTDGEKRKRGNSEVDSEEESNAFSRKKKTVKEDSQNTNVTPVKSKQKNEDKLDRVLEMLQQLTLDVNQIKQNCMIKKEIQSINTRLEQLEKEKRRNNIVIQGLSVNNNTTEIKEDIEKFLYEKLGVNTKTPRLKVHIGWDQKCK
ncbi:hypothetical protein QE152_g34809 [Popillia japonica]|uniref:Uncharacterized protein n=1 Tax=Popillia japonica TaxID=7064 RepID=A0AAW1ITE0_POPJA